MMDISCNGVQITDMQDTPMKITLFDNRQDAVKRVTYSDGMIHVRGGTTKRYPKLGYKISLTQKSLGENTRKNHISLLGMRKDDDWVLYSAYNDQEKIRNVFSSNLWQYSCATDNEYGINTGMEYRYIELFIDGNYWGLYALGFPIDEKQLEIASNSNEAVLFQKYFWDNESSLRFTGEGISGYELKSVNGILDYDAFVEKWLLLVDYYRNLYVNSSDNEFLYGGIDIDNAIDTYLYLNLIQGQDAVDKELIKNIYITIKKDCDNLKAIYSPWDMDTTWGNSWDGSGDNDTLKYNVASDYNQVMESGYLYQLITNKDPNIWQKIIGKYNELRSSVWSNEFICALLDEYEEDIYYSGAYLRDMARWPDGTYANAEEGLSVFRRFVLDRLNEYDEYYKRIEALSSKSIFVIRSAQYKNFPYCNFVIELGDKSALSDSDYVDLLEYIGIDTGEITNDISYILVNGKERKVAYFSNLEEARDSLYVLGDNLRIDIDENGAYTLYQNDKECYTGDYPGNGAFKLIFIDSGNVEEFDFSRGYEFDDSGIITDMYTYIKNLSSENRSIIFEIRNKDILNFDEYLELFENLGVDVSQLSADTDFIIVDNASKKTDILNNFKESGSMADTSVGKLSLFIADDELRAMYLNDMEFYITKLQDDNNSDIGIIIFDKASLSIKEYAVFSYETDLTPDGSILKTTMMKR